MSISYSGIVGYGKSILPSVETWGTNMNILRDPPKAIYTRKIDKVGQTSEITAMVDDSGDRITDVISVYARGINPMVAVSYDNYGRNGGQKITGNMKNAFLPYRVMREGAFRPPIREQRDLLPLSRLPRVWTSSYTQPGFADFSKKAMCPSDEAKGVKTYDEMLRPCVNSNVTYSIETPVVEPFQQRYSIKNTTQVPVSSGITTQARFNGEHSDPYGQIVNNPLHPDLNVNIGNSEMRQNVDVNFDTDGYIHDRLDGSMSSNLSQNRQVTPIDEILGVNTDSRTRRVTQIELDSRKTGYEKYGEYATPELQRSLPQYQARTNVGQNVHKSMEHTTERVYNMNRPVVNIQSNQGVQKGIDNISSRQYNLKPTIQAGGYSPNLGLPAVTTDSDYVALDSQKTRMRQRVFDMQMSRA